MWTLSILSLGLFPLYTLASSSHQSDLQQFNNFKTRSVYVCVWVCMCMCVYVCTRVYVCVIVCVLRYSKTYSSKEEEYTRFQVYTTLHHTTPYHTTPHYTTLHYTTLHYTTLQVFRRNLRKYSAHSLTSSYTVGVTQFSDLLPSEFQASYLYSVV